jgi:hypothetical protein
MRESPIVLLLAAALGLAAPTQAKPGEPLLGTPDQIALDRVAVAIFTSPEVRREKAALAKLFEQDPLAATPDGKARIGAALDAITFASILGAVNDDPYRPVILWTSTAPQDWGGLKVPASGYGIDNADNVYRQLTIDGGLRYEISGRLRADGPTQESFLLYRFAPGTRPANDKAEREGSPVLGALTAGDLKTAPDGSYTITIDKDPANGRPNHIQSGDNPDERLIIRNTLSDWTTQTPDRLTLKLVDAGTPKPAPTQAEITRQSRDVMKIMVPFWIKYAHDYVFNFPSNALPQPTKRDGGWGYGAMGGFDLKPDEGLLVTVAPLGAHYIGFQVADVWTVAPDYKRHTSSLNNHQAAPNPDGTFTYLVSPRDPGICNWIDTVGLHKGIALIRWQELADRSVSADHAIVAQRVVKLTDLPSTLPPGTKMCTSAERRRQQTDRALSYERRLSAN